MLADDVWTARRCRRWFTQISGFRRLGFGMVSVGSGGFGVKVHIMTDRNMAKAQTTELAQVKFFQIEHNSSWFSRKVCIMGEVALRRSITY